MRLCFGTPLAYICVRVNACAARTLRTQYIKPGGPFNTPLKFFPYIHLKKGLAKTPCNSTSVSLCLKKKL